MTRRRDAGFSLIELAIVVLIFGLIAAISVPTIRTFNSTNKLQGATENLAAQIRLAREKAIGTGADQTFHFYYNNAGGDYHIHNVGSLGPVWRFPRGIVYDETPGDDLDTLRLKRDGRASPAGSIVLMDSRGVRDTISIQLSGLVLTK